MHIAMNYLDKKCVVCGVKYWSVDLFLEKNPICVGTNPLRIACKKCFEDNKDKLKSNNLRANEKR